MFEIVLPRCQQKSGHSFLDSYRSKTLADAASNLYDVVILGGGLSGLTLALQIKKMRSTARIVVIEKQQHPVPEAAHKVGEST